MYKLEQNINNEIAAVENKKNRNICSEAPSDSNSISKASKQEDKDIDSEKSCEPLMLSWHLKKNYHDFKNNFHAIERTDGCSNKKADSPDVKSDFIPLDKFLSNSNDTDKQLTLSEAEHTLTECRNSILDAASPSALLYASYLLNKSARRIIILSLRSS